MLGGLKLQPISSSTISRTFGSISSSSPTQTPNSPLPPPPPSYKKGSTASVSIRAVHFDATAKVSLIEEEAKIVEFCAKHSLLRRDLKYIIMGNKNPSILVREQALIVNMAGITALIKPDSVFIFDYGTSSSSAIAQEVHSFLMHELHGRLESKDSAFYELRALEAVLTGIIHSLTLRQSLLIPKIQVALKALSLDVDQETLKSLHLFKNDLTQFESKVSTIGDILRKLLLNDEDMANMYLTDKKSTPRLAKDHQEVEYLLEHFQEIVEEIESVNVTTLTAIHATESLVQLSLDAQRNNLIIFDLQATLGSLSIAGVTLVTSIFGMNLLHGLEQSPGIFSLVTMSSIGIGSALFVAGLRKVRRIRSDSIGTGTLVLKDYKRIINGS